MKLSHIVLICMVILSMLALHECGRIHLEEIERSVLKVALCTKTVLYNQDSWCCFGPNPQQKVCWVAKDYPNAKEICLHKCPF
ncbi:hypothetical protein CARUB_v10015719mg [Capsella rubella]|uniref:Embryo surrounding factor 1 brassicaceae domain-containing protein n=1 Tax=Capsella rubella TaxID=81985 RepID=R0G2C1_9BRAS|nr:hypothetical protein CARUB_v10015719mg [Capsella rubella]